MKPGDRFETYICKDGSFNKIEYEVCTMMGLIAFLRERNGRVFTFDDPAHLCLGFGRDERAVAVALTEVKNAYSVLPDWLRDDLPSVEGRFRIAERCSA
jgi:hypothetical protein